MQVYSSLSGIPFYATSAGSAPTNSADVSAIASAYQVVSATATQLNAGTAYLTSVNETQISAARAGNAANASLANSAWYDGTGRLISSLPDEATVSGIASAYAESAASGKQDTLTFDWDADSAISSINGSALAGQGGGGLVTAIGASTSGITSINNSGLVDTAALRSADYSSLYVQEPLYISASGGSSYIGISGDVGGIDSATCSAIASAYAESAVSSVSGNYYTTANESGFLTAQVQASWSESASASPSYIQDKPDLVDIVAGPGIVVDNPDGNTLRVSLAYPTDRTVLYNNGSVSVKTATLSETIDNFEWLMVRMDDDHHGGRWVIVDTSNPWAKWLSNYGYDAWNTSSTKFGIRAIGFTASGTTITSITGCQKQVGWNSTAWDGDHQTGQFAGIVKVVGIHRIANN